MQSEDLQQPGIRGIVVTVGVTGLWSGVSADAYVHDPDELREGLGRGISPADSHLDSLLDRAAFKRAAAVARQGTHANGLASPTLFLDVLSFCILHPFVRKRRIHEDTLHVLSSSSTPSIRFFVVYGMWKLNPLSRVPSNKRCTVTCARRRHTIFAFEDAVSNWKRMKAQTQRNQVSFAPVKPWLSRIVARSITKRPWRVICVDEKVQNLNGDSFARQYKYHSRYIKA